MVKYEFEYIKNGVTLISVHEFAYEPSLDETVAQMQTYNPDTVIDYRKIEE